MLTSNAFNAFLKTLEEPPKHAIFILATTEKNKVLPTILSRCQIYDFNRIPVEVIVKHLQDVARVEGINAEDEALNVIAQKADGGLRDALSIFDQIATFSGRNITYQAVLQNLNVLDHDYYFRLVEAFVNGDTVSTLTIYNDILNRGFDGSHFINGLSSHLRDLLMCKFPQTESLLQTGSFLRPRYQEQASHCNDDFLYEALQVAATCDLSFKEARNKRLHVELALIALSRVTPLKKKLII